MRSIVLSAFGSAPQVREKLHYYLKDFSNEGMFVKIDEKEQGQLSVWNCSLYKDKEEPSAEEERYFTYYMAKTVSDIIISDIEKRIIGIKIEREYPYFSQHERGIIQSNMLDLMRHGFYSCNGAFVDSNSQQTEVFQKVWEYLNDNNNICVDGFISFRLRDFLEGLDDVLEKAVDDYIVEREYKDFIRVLRYFVELQEPRIEEVHIFVKGTGVFQLEDAAARPIKGEHLEEFSIGLSDGRVEYEDLLISTLIAISPGKIIFHASLTRDYAQVLGILYNVFGSKLEVCHSCVRCQTGENPSTSQK